jgi:CRP-like cAMP-binding protein
MSTLAWLPPSLLQLSTHRDLGSGEVLFRQGDAVSAIYEVEEGRIRLLRYTIDDHVAVLHTAASGESFAEAALFSEAYHCDAVASMATRVRGYPKRELLETLLGDPQLAAKYMSVLAHEMQTLRTRLEQRNIRTARDRVLQHLALSADAASRTVPLHGTLMDLAGEIGLTHETLYRTLAALESERIIARTKDKIVLLRGKSL